MTHETMIRTQYMPYLMIERQNVLYGVLLLESGAIMNVGEVYSP